MTVIAVDYDVIIVTNETNITIEAEDVNAAIIKRYDQLLANDTDWDLDTCKVVRK